MMQSCLWNVTKLLRQGYVSVNKGVRSLELGVRVQAPNSGLLLANPLISVYKTNFVKWTPICITIIRTIIQKNM